MSWFRKKPDPISDRSRSLKHEIASLEAQIRDLSRQIEEGPPKPRLRSTTVPEPHTPQKSPAPKPPPREPVFEKVDHLRVQAGDENRSTSQHFNDLGVRKYDLVAAWRRLLNHFRGPPASNPRLLSYLAAGSVQGLRPLRYEKRVARNRLLALAGLLLLLLWGIIYAIQRR